MLTIEERIDRLNMLSMAQGNPLRVWYMGGLIHLQRGDQVVRVELKRERDQVQFIKNLSLQLIN